MEKKLKTLGSIRNRNAFDGSLLYRGDEFEKKTGREKYLTARENDINKWFVDGKNFKVKTQYAEKRRCPLCEEQQFLLLFNKDGFDHVKCSGCNFVFVSPVLTNEALRMHYANENDWIRVMLSDEEKKVNRLMYAYALKFLKRESKLDSRKLLDIGSGSGLFLEEAAKIGLDGRGVELNKEMIERSKKKGLNVIDEDLTTLGQRYGRQALVTMWFVLEHIKDVKGFVNDVSRLVFPKGLLLVAVPQLDSLANRLYGKESPTYAGYSHINFFNLDYLNRLLVPFGFKLVAAETQITQLNNIRKYFEKFGVTRNSGIRTYLNTLIPQYIHKNMLGSNLIAVYRKIKE